MAGFDGLRAAFEEIERLNLQALDLLERVWDLQALQPLFERKSAINAALPALLTSDGSEGPGEGLAAVQGAQAAAARSEVKLAERLAQLVPSIGNASHSYAAQKLDKPGGRYDTAV